MWITLSAETVSKSTEIHALNATLKIVRNVMEPFIWTKANAKTAKQDQGAWPAIKRDALSVKKDGLSTILLAGAISALLHL